MIPVIECALDHTGFSVIECRSESGQRGAVRDGRSRETVSCQAAANQCVEFFPGAFEVIPEKKRGSAGPATFQVIKPIVLKVLRSAK